MLQGSFQAEAVVHFTLTNEVMVLNIPDHRKTFAVKKDEIMPGVSVVNSEVGWAAFGIPGVLSQARLHQWTYQRGKGAEQNPAHPDRRTGGLRGNSWQRSGPCRPESGAPYDFSR